MSAEIEYKTYIGEDIDIVVHFEIEPEEPMTRGHPGCAAELVFNDIALVDGNSIMDILNKETLDKLEVECFEHANELAYDAYLSSFYG